MIEWLRNRFSSFVSFLFAITVIAFTIVGAIIGNLWGRGTSNEILIAIIGASIGFIIGLIVGIGTYGFCATVIHISESTDSLLESTNAILRKLK